MDSARIILRGFTATDRNFILATWLKGQRWGSNYFNDIPQELYFREYARVLEKALSAPGLQVIIACDADKPSWIYGFAVIQGDSLLWVYVKTDYREQGIAKAMLAGKPIKYAKSLTRIGRSIAAKKGIVFNPF